MSLVRFRPEAPFADLAHLVERDLAKVEVAGSSPVIRSKQKSAFARRRIFVCILHYSLFIIHFGQADFELIMNNEAASLMNNE